MEEGYGLRKHLRLEERGLERDLLGRHVLVRKHSETLGPVADHAKGPVRRLYAEAQQRSDRVRPRYLCVNTSDGTHGRRWGWIT